MLVHGYSDNMKVSLNAVLGIVMNVNIIVLNIIFSIYSKFSVKHEIF